MFQLPRRPLTTVAALSLSLGSLSVVPGCRESEDKSKPAPHSPEPVSGLFSQPEVVRLVGPLMSSTMEGDPRLSGLETQLIAAGIQNSASDRIAKLDGGQSDLLIKGHEVESKSDVPQLVVDISIGLGTEERLVRKIEALLRFAPFDQRRDEYLVSVLENLQTVDPSVLRRYS